MLVRFASDYQRGLVIDFAEILDKTEIVPDDEARSPWDDDEAWKHDFRKIEYPDHDAQKDSIRWVRRIHHVTDSGLLLITDPADWFGVRPYPGAAKQVCKEYCARMLHDAYAQLKTWYEEGWSYWGIECDLGDFRDGYDVREAHWGYLTDAGNDNDPYLREHVLEIAHETARTLKQQGYCVVNIPRDPVTPGGNRYKCDLYRRAHALGFKTPDEYFQWLKSPPSSSKLPSRRRGKRSPR